MSEDEGRLRDEAAWLERNALLGLVVGGLAHELNNIFGRILGFSELALEEEISEEVRESLVEVRDSVLEATEYSRWLGRFSQRRRAAAETVDVAAVLEGLSLTLTPELKASGATLGVEAPGESLAVLADTVLVVEALAAACLLRFRASSDAGSVTVAVRAQDDRVLFVVDASGTVPPPGVLEGLFEPALRDGGGTALRQVLARMRLLVPRAVARGFGGELAAEGPGRLVLSLPRASGPVPPALE